MHFPAVPPLRSQTEVGRLAVMSNRLILLDEKRSWYFLCLYGIFQCCVCLKHFVLRTGLRTGITFSFTVQFCTIVLPREVILLLSVNFTKTNNCFALLLSLFCLSNPNRDFVCRYEDILGNLALVGYFGDKSCTWDQLVVDGCYLVLLWPRCS